VEERRGGESAAEVAQPTDGEVSLSWRKDRPLVHAECKPESPRWAKVRLVAPETTHENVREIKC